ncbi:Glycopeptide [Mycena venus]|uniref:Glycopeptide n=1 Tax=Mycena venus TaxID=2733690 RepID=A0A8H6Z3P4_9AGAR|nr:Glycopeptide [Mycena venus]KAF7372124.1 Glycopeptide [Mycena venus]
MNAFLGAALLTGLRVRAETHTVYLNNKCGCGTSPMLIRGGQVLSSGANFTINGPLSSAIAYLQTTSGQQCGFNGEGCALIETTLTNPVPGRPGSGSSTDISLIPPHNFTVPVGFRYFNGCDGNGTECLLANCSTAFHRPEDTKVQVACQQDDVNLEIIFCSQL